MTAADKALLHAHLLRCLAANGDKGRPASHLLTDARMAGYDIALPVLEAELRALGDLGWIIAVDAPLVGKRYRITALGESKLLEAGV